MVFGFLKKKSAAEEGSSSPPSEDANQSEILSKTDFEKTEKVVSTGAETTELEANRELKFLNKLHKWDPNLSADIQQEIQDATERRDVNAETELINLIENDSPYPEVRAAVRNYDEEYPSATIRAWTIGLLLVTLGSGMNMLFSLRSPAIVVTSFVATLVAYPIGLLWDKIMPKALCNGKFNQKEHALITIMANVCLAAGPAYSMYTITALKAKQFYGFEFGWGFELLLTISTQMTGYAFAGLLRKFLVWPAAMLWPQTFVSTSLFYALHDHSPTDPSKADGWSIGRYRYFIYVFLGAFVWYWFPGWIFQALSYFSFATWIAPNNVTVNQLFGYTSGLGLIPITFDWTQITGFTYSPLMFPWHGIANTLIGVVGFFMILSIILHYSNWQYAMYLPMSDSNSYDNTGATYNVSRILSPQNTLDLQKYQNYSPLFLSTTFALTYGLSFATFIAVIVHTVLYHGSEVWLRAKMAMGEEPDIHTKMMRKYKEVPALWYAAVGLVCFALCLTTCLVWDTKLTWWALIVALLVAMFFSIPIGMVQATTNVTIGLNVITEFIIGYMQPGRPVAMMLFKTYGYISMTQALYFCQDLKIGHYMKIPPRHMFCAQIVATLWSCVVQVAVVNWAFGTIPEICSRQQVSRYICPGGRVFFNASVIWGVIGPERMFGNGQIYNGLMYFFIAGLMAPIIFYTLARRYPKSNLRFLSAPIIFGGSGQIPPATTVNYTTWAAVGWLFNKYLKNKYNGWWSNYNYITSAGLDIGLAICTILIFLTLSLTGTSAPSWWGNNVITTTLDATGEAISWPVPDSGTFGPTSW